MCLKIAFCQPCAPLRGNFPAKWDARLAHKVWLGALGRPFLVHRLMRYSCPRRSLLSGSPIYALPWHLPSAKVRSSTSILDRKASYLFAPLSIRPHQPASDDTIFLLRKKPALPQQCQEKFISASREKAMGQAGFRSGRRCGNAYDSLSFIFSVCFLAVHAYPGRADSGWHPIYGNH